MDEGFATKAIELTSVFYERVGESFSKSRQSVWPGWERVLAELNLAIGTQVRLLDLACGNLRFERFLQERGVTAEVVCVDDCDALVLPALAAFPEVSYQHINLTHRLMTGEPLDVSSCELCVCFGFMHHLPTARLRQLLLSEMLEHTLPGGHSIVSFWQFEQDERLLNRARAATQACCAAYGLRGLEDGDYFMGWADEREVFRFCHSFSEAEIDELVASLGNRAREICRYSSDGRTGKLNRYLVLQHSIH